MIKNILLSLLLMSCAADSVVSQSNYILSPNGDSVYISIDSIAYFQEPINPPSVVDEYTIDDFDSHLRISNWGSQQGNPPKLYYHNMFHTTQAGVTSTGSERVENGELIISVDTGDVYYQHYTYLDSAGGNHFTHEVAKDTSLYQFDYYNRIVIKGIIPAGYPKHADTNIKFGTYLADSSCVRSNQECNGFHFYHHLNIIPTGYPFTVYIDGHPDYIRDGASWTEFGNRSYPISQTPDKNYPCDVLTRYYWDGHTDFPSVEWRFDYVKFIRQENLEEEHFVYSLGATRVNQDSVYVFFRTDKNLSKNEEYYIYASNSSHHDSGLTNQVGTLLKPYNNGGFNGVNGIVAISINSPYIAVRYDGQTLFKEIHMEE